MKSFRQSLKESIIDIPRKHYSRTIFDRFNTGDPILKPSVKDFIEKGMTAFETVAPIKKYLLIGSMLTKQYRKDADLDINMLFDLPPGKRESTLTELRKMVGKINGKMIPGTKHPVNYYIIGDKPTFDRANEMADNVYDIVNSNFMKRSAEQEFSVRDYMKDFTKTVEKIDILKGELDRDIVDYEELKELDKDDIDNLSGQVKKKIGEIEKDMGVLISMGHGIWNERQGAFKKDMTPKEIQKYGTHNRLPKNVVYKMLEKYYYIKLVHDLEDILGDDEKLSDTEADKLVKNIPDISEEKEKKGEQSSYMDVGHYILHRDMKQVELFHHGAVSGHKQINHLKLYKKVAATHKKRTKGKKLHPTWADHAAWLSQVEKKKGRAEDEAGDSEHSVQGRIDHKTKTYTVSNSIPDKDATTSETHQARVINRLIKITRNRLTRQYPEYKEHRPEDTGAKGYHVSTSHGEGVIYTFGQFIHEQKRKSYLNVGHPRMKHIKGEWVHPHIELYTKAHGGSMHKTPLSNKIDAHDMWDKSNEHIENERVHANGRIDHKKQEYSAVVHISASKREPHPKAIRRAYDDVHKYMEEHHPEYTGHEQGHQFY